VNLPRKSLVILVLDKAEEGGLGDPVIRVPDLKLVALWVKVVDDKRADGVSARSVIVILKVIYFNSRVPFGNVSLNVSFIMSMCPR
jgi:hypothetical protein